MDTERMIKNLNKVIALDYDAIAAYDTAIDRLDSSSFKGKLTEFRDDHKRHVRDLGEAVRREGGSPADSGDMMQVLTQGKVVLADMSGDRAILKAMKKNEDQTNKTYEQAVSEGYPAPIQNLLEEGLADERRHRAWLERTIEEAEEHEATGHTASRDTGRGRHPHGPNR